MRTLTVTAVALTLFLFEPSLFAISKALGEVTVEVIHGPTASPVNDADVDISMMPTPEELFEKHCGRVGTTVELRNWISADDPDKCPKE